MAQFMLPEHEVSRHDFRATGARYLDCGSRPSILFDEMGSDSGLVYGDSGCAGNLHPVALMSTCRQAIATRRKARRDLRYRKLKNSDPIVVARRQEVKVRRERDRQLRSKKK